MSSTNIALLQTSGPMVPARGTLGSLANTFYAKGTLVGRDANGRAYSYATADASGNPVVGVSFASYDNRTNAEAGGLNDSIDINVDYGVHGYAISGTTPKPFDRLYAVDNQTVSISDNGGTRGFAGICSEVRTLNGAVKAFFQIGPLNGLSGAESGSTGSRTGVPILSALVAGAPLAAFSNGASATPGTDFTDSKVTSVRWNNNATCTPIEQSVYLPGPSDPAAPAVVHALVSKVGATLGDATTLTIQAYSAMAGELHDVGTDMGGTSSAVVGNAASKTIQEVTLTLAGASLEDAASTLTLTIQPTNGTLGTDDFCIHAVWITR